MDFQLKEKLSRLDEERQRKRAQRAEEAVRRLEDLGKQTLAMIEQAKPEQQLERLRSDQKVQQPPKDKIGRLSRVLFEAATRMDVTNPAFDPEYGDRRVVHTIGKALPRPQKEIENRAKKTLGHIDEQFWSEAQTSAVPAEVAEWRQVQFNSRSLDHTATAPQEAPAWASHVLITASMVAAGEGTELFLADIGGWLM